MKIQRLTMPFNCTVHKETQYGITMTSSDGLLYSSGVGWVRSIGISPIFNRFVCIVYDNVMTKDNQNIGSVLIRYCNLSELSVKKGKRVSNNMLLGKIGIVPDYGYLLYLEADKDIRFTNYTPSLTEASGDLRAGYRGEKGTTFSPLSILY